MEPRTMTKAEIRSRLDAMQEEAASIRRAMRRGHCPQTLAEHIEWEREFGAEFDAQFAGRSETRTRVELYKSLAREYGQSYATVKAAFAGV
jgi:hypothetical protein